MATYPPPSSPPPGSSARDQARLFKEQRRASQESAKAQVRYQREQFRAMRRRSILGPLFLLTLGILLLLGRLGHFSLLTGLAWYARWWPLLLVAAGLILVAEWVWDERTARQAPDGMGLPVRRTLGGGVIFLLILLALAGLALRGIHENGFLLAEDFFHENNGFARFLGQEHEEDQVLDLALPASGELLIDNPHGDVILSGDGTDGKIHILAHKRIYSSSDNEATRKFEDLAPELKTAGGILRLSVPSQDGSNADLTISLPSGYPASVDAAHGEVRISGMKAALHITAHQGDVDVASVTGPVSVRLNGRSSSFSAHDVSGDLALMGTGEDVTLSDMKGSVTLDGDFYGETHLEHLSGPVHFRTSRTAVSFASLPGTFDISPHAELSGSGITGPTRVETYSRNISLTSVVGNVIITNRNGSVDVEMGTPTGNINIMNQSGGVVVTLPASLAATLHARSSDGHISDEFAPQPLASGKEATLDGQVGNGSSRVELTTSNADIEIRKSPRP